MSDGTDYLGDPLPPGYEPWDCDTCTAVCNYEAMTLCARALVDQPGSVCGFDRDQPESNGGHYGFIVPVGRLLCSTEEASTEGSANG